MGASTNLRHCSSSSFQSAAYHGNLKYLVGIMRRLWFAAILLAVVAGRSAFTRPKHHVVSKSRRPNKWGDWSEWSECHQECNGKQHQIRKCIRGVQCIGRRQERDCNLAGNGLELSTRCPDSLTRNISI